MLDIEYTEGTPVLLQSEFLMGEGELAEMHADMIKGWRR